MMEWKTAADGSTFGATDTNRKTYEVAVLRDERAELDARLRVAGLLDGLDVLARSADRRATRERLAEVDALLAELAPTECADRYAVALLTERGWRALYCDLETGHDGSHEDHTAEPPATLAWKGSAEVTR